MFEAQQYYKEIKDQPKTNDIDCYYTLHTLLFSTSPQFGYCNIYSESHAFEDKCVQLYTAE